MFYGFDELGGLGERSRTYRSYAEIVGRLIRSEGIFLPQAGRQRNEKMVNPVRFFSFCWRA